MKVGLVDDSAFMRMVLRQILSAADDIDVAWEAADGDAAITCNAETAVDLIITDMEMPRCDGLQLLTRLKSGNVATECLIISSFHAQGGEKIIEAMRIGAAGFLPKSAIGDTVNLDDFRRRLIAWVRLFGEEPLKSVPYEHAPQLATVENTGALQSNADFLVIIGSAGSIGPLEEILQVCTDLEWPLIVAVHMPADMETTLINRIFKDVPSDKRPDIHLDNVPRSGGTVTFLRGGALSKLSHAGDEIAIQYRSADSGRDIFAPNIDDFLESCLAVGFLCDVVVLSGLCRDGVAGALLHRMNGGLLMVQDTAAAIAKSMPTAIAESGEAHVMATSQAMAEILARTYKRHKDARLL